MNGFLDSRGRYSARLEEFGSPGRVLLLGLVLRLDQNRFIDNELTDVFCCDELRMAVVYHLIDNLVNENKVLSNAFLIEYAAVVTEDLHHAVDDVKNG